MKTNFIELHDDNTYTCNAHVLVLTERFVDSIDECRIGYYDQSLDQIKLKKEIKDDICLFKVENDLQPKSLGLYCLSREENNNSSFVYIKKIQVKQPL